MSEKAVSLVFRIEGGTADEGLLDIYDAANTIYGLARTVNLIAHAFANDDEVRKKNQSAHGATAYINPSKKGCFEEQVQIEFDSKTVNKIGTTVLANAFWDYTNWACSSAIGYEYEPTTPYVKKVAEKSDVFIYEIADALESPMALLHKSIRRDSSVVAYIARPRVGDIITLDNTSLDYVTTREEATDTEYILGNVTRFNVLSHFGRLFSNEEGRVISFELANPDESRISGLAIDSMRDHNDGKDGKVRLKVSKVVSAQGVVKRYIVHDMLPVSN